MPTIYKIDYPNANKPKAQEVEKAGFPNFDADGEMQFINTHFTDEKEAWDALISELEAALSLDSKEVIKAAKKLQTIKDRLAETCILLEDAKRGRESFFDSL